MTVIPEEETCRCLCHSGNGRCGVAPCCSQSGKVWARFKKEEGEKTFAELSADMAEIKEREAQKT